MCLETYRLSHKDNFNNFFYGVTSPYVFCYHCVLHHSCTVPVHFNFIFQSLAWFRNDILSKRIKNLWYIDICRIIMENALKFLREFSSITEIFVMLQLGITSVWITRWGFDIIITSVSVAHIGIEISWDTGAMVNICQSNSFSVCCSFRRQVCKSAYFVRRPTWSWVSIKQVSGQSGGLYIVQITIDLRFLAWRWIQSWCSNKCPKWLICSQVPWP